MPKQKHTHNTVQLFMILSTRHCVVSLSKCLVLVHPSKTEKRPARHITETC